LYKLFVLKKQGILMSIFHLPTDLANRVFSFSSFPDLQAASQICKETRDHCNHSSLWKQIAKNVQVSEQTKEGVKKKYAELKEVNCIFIQTMKLITDYGERYAHLRKWLVSRVPQGTDPFHTRQLIWQWIARETIQLNGKLALLGVSSTECPLINLFDILKIPSTVQGVNVKDPRLLHIFQEAGMTAVPANPELRHSMGVFAGTVFVDTLGYIKGNASSLPAIK
jgi:F-box-like